MIRLHSESIFEGLISKRWYPSGGTGRVEGK